MRTLAVSYYFFLKQFNLLNNFHSYGHDQDKAIVSFSYLRSEVVFQYFWIIYRHTVGSWELKQFGDLLSPFRSSLGRICFIFLAFCLMMCNTLLQEPGEAEEEFERVNTARIIKKFLISRKPGPLCVPKSVGFGGSPHNPITLPSWLSEEDVNYYATKFNQTGFTGGLNYYRAMDL